MVVIHTPDDGEEHNRKCELADLNTRCRCACDGRLHGISRANAKTDEPAKPMNIGKAGGEIQAFFHPLLGRDYACVCGDRVPIGQLMAYPHGGGMKDDHGQRWWVFCTCDACGAQMSGWHLPGRLVGRRK